MAKAELYALLLLYFIMLKLQTKFSHNFGSGFFCFYGS